MRFSPSVMPPVEAAAELRRSDSVYSLTCFASFDTVRPNQSTLGG
jgi:hypothetical protein